MRKADLLKIETHNPYDLDLKKTIHPEAIAENIVIMQKDKPTLRCGHVKDKVKRTICLRYAGAGTDHKGYGVCKECEQLVNARIQAEKDALAQRMKEEHAMTISKVSARRKHGLYSHVLRGEELEIYEQLNMEARVSLEHEIFVLQAKVISYLNKWNKAVKEGGEEAARQYTMVGDGDSKERVFYTAGAADDRVLQRALETLRRLVDSHAKMDNGTDVNLIDTVNDQLRKASQGEVTLAWNTRPAQNSEAKEAGEDAEEN